MRTISYRYDEQKATQAACRLLEKSGGRINHMKLLKLLYLIDREALRRWQRPLTGDRPYSMPYGPVLSLTYDLIGRHPIGETNRYWCDHVTETQEYSVLLKQRAGTDALSEAEIALIDQVFDSFGKKSEFELVEYCHRNCPEWRDPGDSSVPISFEEILAQVGWSKDIPEIAAEQGAFEREEAIFGVPL